MTLSELGLAQFNHQVTDQGIAFKTGRFTSKIKLDKGSPFTSDLFHLYQFANLINDDDVIDFNVSVTSPSRLRRYWRPKVDFKMSGLTPFLSLPKAQTLPLVEWGLNWCVSQHFHHCLIIHAAVVEKNGVAIVMPGMPGAGKSTLCAALVLLGGWRLLSDELTLIDLSSSQVLSNPRPISLKNRSIDIIKEAAPQTFSSHTVKDTVKGTVSHFQPPRDSIERFDDSADIRYVIFPKYKEGTQETLEPVTKPRAFLELANQSFNYPILGKLGFDALAKGLDGADCYNFVYDGDLQHAITQFEQLLLESLS
ncbi:HprK-related kinase A [Thalassotalea ganghwensis]